MGDRLLQVASSFTSIPIAQSLRPICAHAGIADQLEFSQYSQMTEYMLGPAPDSPQIMGTIVLVRIEDWLRADLKTGPAGVPSDLQKVRQNLRTQVDDFAGQVASLARRGKPVWFVACPSTGWIAERHKLETLCRTFTNLLVTRIQSLTGVTSLAWPAALFSNSDSSSGSNASPSDFIDRNADRLGQMPFTQEAFDRLGRYVGEQIERTSVGRPLGDAPPPDAATPDLAAYLTGLQVKVRISAAEPGDRPHVDRLLRTVAAFSLTGEKRDLTEAEVDGLLEPGRCMVIRVSDRLSDHGPGGLVAFRPTEGSLVVDAMALSCPVLGKQVEYAVILGLAQIAAERQCTSVVFEYRPSGRNQLTRTFLTSVTDAESDGRYVLRVNQAGDRIKKAAVAAGTWTLEFAT